MDMSKAILGKDSALSDQIESGEEVPKGCFSKMGEILLAFSMAGPRLLHFDSHLATNSCVHMYS